MDATAIGFVNNGRLDKCLRLADRVKYRNKYLRDPDFCRKNFFDPLQGIPGYFSFDSVLDRVINALMENGIHSTYEKEIRQIVLTDPEYQELIPLKSEHILALATLCYFLGHLYLLAMRVLEPSG